MIGVSTSEIRMPQSTSPMPQGDPARRELALGLSYLRAIESAGGLPVIMPPLDDEAIAPLLGRLDGICLSGGPDIDPSHYGAEPHPSLGPTETDIDRFELAAARVADQHELPILAICRGAQALNVSRGGTLNQHVPERYGESIGHRQTITGDETIHDVSIEPGTRLASVVGSDRIEVNSFHHQSIDRLGDGLDAVAHSGDGVIEAVEQPGERFVIGVQWHAESLTGMPEHAALFEGLIEAAGEREPAGTA
jgi:putative glutamine amidotransferase